MAAGQLCGSTGWNPSRQEGWGRAGVTSVRRRTSSGRSTATAMATAAPIEFPTTVAGPNRSSTRVTTAAAAGSVAAAAEARVRPKPGRSIAVTRACNRRASAGPASSQWIVEPPRPWRSNSVAVPVPDGCHAV